MDFRRLKNEALGAIDAALTMMTNLPETANINASINASSNPLSFAVQILRSVNGSDAVINYIAYVVASALPAIEVKIKALLLSNIRNLLTCSHNPVLSDEILLDGVVVPIENIDLLGTLQYSPLDAANVNPEFGIESEEDLYNPNTAKPLNWTPQKLNLGKYYYFGCEQMESVGDLEKAGDFNAWLWWVMNCSPKRAAWHGVKKAQSMFGDSVWGRNTYTTQNEPKPDDYAEEQKGDKQKDKKGAGILTLDYQKNPSSLRNAEGKPLKIRVPFNNALQVLIGNCEPRGIDVKNATERVRDINNQLDSALKTKTKLEQKKYQTEYKITQLRAKLSEGNATLTEDQKKAAKDSLDKLENELKSIVSEINKTKASSEELNKQLKDAEFDIKNALGDNEAYQDIERNYYYTTKPNLIGTLTNISDAAENAWNNITGVRTLVEFNYDYIMSLKLFDSKVVLAQLIDALSGCISFDLGLSFEQRVVREEVEKTVRAVIESDDAVISDCFFKFDNDEYNRMLTKAELEHAGFFAPDGTAAGPSTIDPEVLLSTINSINNSASLSEVETVIEGSLREITRTMYSTTEETVNKLQFDLDISNVLMSELTYVLVSAFLSPKVYLLFAVNLAILGQNTDISVKDFITNHRNLITMVIRDIRDKLIEEMYNKIKKLLDTLAATQAKLFQQEQYDYYRRLIKRCIDCFNRRRGNLDFNIDNVNYADIRQTEEESDSPRNEC